MGENRCVCCRLNAHAVGFEQGDKNGVEDNVEDRTAGDNGHCLFKLALAANDHVGALEEIHEQGTGEHDPQIFFCIGQDVVTGSGQG